MSRTVLHRAIVSLFMAGAVTSMVANAATGVHDALDSGRIGLFPAERFRLADGQCTDCNTIPQALWYFGKDTIATPKENAEGFERKLRAQDDVKAWASAHPAGDAAAPGLIWIGSSLLSSGMRMNADGNQIAGVDGNVLPFRVAPKIASNLSYYDASSLEFFSARALTMRGSLQDGSFVARTLWPEDFSLDFAKLPYQPLAANESLTSLVRADGKTPSAPLAARVLWQRDVKAPRDWVNKPVLAFMLNGAQGDDDEAHGGHFAIATGAFGPRGEWNDWLVNNFYNLGAISEKGIVASMLPMDAYMADLNSGQSWYRPSYMLVAVLKDGRTSARYQSAMGRVFNHFYRQDFLYRHATANCAGISMETLRSLGWQIPKRGATSRLKATVALPYMAIKDRDLESGTKAYDYLSAEQTDLYPFVAFDAAAQDLLTRITSSKAATQGIEAMLAEDIEAIIYVRIPQFPSSRVWGQAPVVSLDEYMSRVPEDRTKWKTVPVPPREFLVAMKDNAAPSDDAPPSRNALIAYGVGICVGGLGLLGTIRRRRKFSRGEKR